jgi:hypothetical protein
MLPSTSPGLRMDGVRACRQCFGTASSQLLGDRVKINSVSIANGKIVVDMVTAGPGDGPCCPTLHVVQTYQLQGAQLVKLS